MDTNLKMDAPKNDIKVLVKDPLLENRTNLIEWNVDMNVTLSGSKKLQFIQRIKNLLIFILVVAFAVVFSHLKGEIRALQVQINDMNANLVILMLKYDKLDKNCNFLQRSYERFQMNAKDLKRFTRRDFNNHFIQVTQIPSREIVVENLKKQNEKEMEKNPNSSSEFKNERINIENKEKDNVQSLENESSKFTRRKKSLRIRRSLLMEKKRNSTDVDFLLENDKSDYDDDDDDDNDDDDINDEDADLESSEYRTSRARRDEGRGKEARKNKNKGRPKRSRRRLGPWIATFVGAQPEQFVTDSVYIGPWVKSTRNESRYNFNKFHLVENEKSIEVTTNGLYMISTQIFYFGESTNYSYWILLSSEGSSIPQRLAKCATVSAETVTEVSCHTSIIILLKRGDRLRLQQQERNRLINLREGHSYIQIALLSSDTQKRRLS
ncbi:uncharacterized protein LOC127279487 isoform X2 [Leptopilina boulardi]|uniref:uncharacterized protein LOC127279487 isoform X2 n=1 Tax=Leptopilina boulardi TaxID=63433 RepID=UPI0021F5DE83|nr:uncharacterized protein LOC127279487 isoform X2 [Leptopilina boulardi]